MAKFKKGNPGGPGRPRGLRNKATLVLDAIAAAGGASLVRSMMKKGQGGDVAAARLMLDRIWPAERGTFVTIDLPDVVDAKSLADAQAQLIAETCKGEEISLEQAGTVSTMLENRRRALETVEIERQLRQAQDNLAEREQAEKARRR